MLREEERAVLRRAAVFAGGWTLEAAEAVCAGGVVAPEAVLDLLGSLVAKSLVQVTTRNRAARYGLLETVRAYAWEHLEASGEAEATARAHAAYYLALAEAAETTPTRSEQMVRLEREVDNLRAALAWALARGSQPARRSGAEMQGPRLQGRVQGGQRSAAPEGVPERVEVGRRLQAALARYRHMHGHLSEGRAWVERLLERLLAVGDRVQGADTATARMTALAAAAWSAQSREDFARARALFEESLLLHRALGTSEGLTDLLINTALIAFVQGDQRRAQELLEESLALHRAAGNRESIGRGGLGLSLYRLAMLTRNQGDFARARVFAEECLALHRELGDREGIAMVLLSLGDIARDQGDAEQARAYGEESLARFQELGVTWGMGFALNNLALAAYQRNELEQALALAAESVRLFRSLGVGMSLAETLTTLGRIARATGDVERARAVLSEALALAWAKGARVVVAVDLEEAAALAVAQGRVQPAARLYGAAAALRAAMGAPLPPYLRAAHDRTVAGVRAALGVAFAAAWAAGEALPLEQAIDEALEVIRRPANSDACAGPSDQASSSLSMGDRRFVNPRV